MRRDTATTVIAQTTKPYGRNPTCPIGRNATARQTIVKVDKATHGVISDTRQRLSRREPIQYQSNGTNSRIGRFATYSGIPGQTIPKGNDASEPARTAGRFNTDTNLYGQGHTWKRAVESRRVWPSNKRRLRIADRRQSPNPPKPIASQSCAIGNRVLKPRPRATCCPPTLLDTTYVERGPVAHRSQSSNSIPRSVFSSRYFTMTGV
jgi:hypothetical protein